jgi:hypothetical protein
MPKITHIYRGDRERHYPYPPIARVLKPGDEIDLDPDEVPEDIPLKPKAGRKSAPSARKPRTRKRAETADAASAGPDQPSADPAAAPAQNLEG